MSVKDLMAEAEDSDGQLAIRMYESNGHESEFLAVPVGGGHVWLHTWTGHQKAHTIDANGVENRLDDRWPDIEIFPEQRSQFAELREGG